MRLGLFILLTLGCVLAHPQAAYAASAPLCRNIWIDSKLNESAIDKLTDLQKTMAGLRTALKQNAYSEDPMSSLKGLEQDPRELAYLLQGAYRLMISHPSAKEILTEKDHSRLEKGLKQMKWLEKTLGTYAVHVELLETAQAKGMAPDFIQFLTDRRNDVSQITLALLKDKNYLDKEISAVAELTEKMAKVDVPEGAQAAVWLKDSLKTEILRIEEKVKTTMAPLIRKPLYGYHEVEEGAHSFRRSLRWIKMYLNAYPGQFRLVSHPNKNLSDAELIAKYQDKFVLRYDSLGQIQIRDLDYALILKSVDALRKIKRNGEMTELLSQELGNFGRYNGVIVTADQARALMTQALKKDEGKIERKTQEMLTDYELRNSFKNIIVEDGK